MLWAVSSRQEPTVPAAKSSPAHLSELPSLGSQVITEFLKAACWDGSCCSLVSAKAARHRDGTRAAQDLLKPTVMYQLLASLHPPSS